MSILKVTSPSSVFMVEHMPPKSKTIANHSEALLRGASGGGFQEASA